MNDPRDIEQELSAAAKRLRDLAPDDHATRQALRSAGRAPSTEAGPARRSWWPLAWAGGLTAAAVIGALVLIGGDTTDTLREVPADAPTTAPGLPEPAETMPTDTSVATEVAVEPTPTDGPVATDPAATQPSDAQTTGDGLTVVTEFRDADCFRLSLDAADRRIGSAAGCVPADSFTPERLFVTMLDQEIYRIDVVDGTENDDVPTLTIDSLPDWETSSCGIIDTARTLSSTDVVFEIVACDRRDPALPVAIVARIQQAVGEQPGYFATPGRIDSGPVTLTAPVAVDGVAGAHVLFGNPDGISRCALIVPAAQGTWSEVCWVGSPPTGQGLVLLNEQVAEIDLSDEAAPTGRLLDERGVPPVGCGLDELRELMSIDEAASRAVVSGAICRNSNATLNIGSQLTGNGPPDGGFIEFSRPDGSGPWTSLGGGTAGEMVRSLAIPAFDVWSQWPGQTRSSWFTPDWADGVTAPTAAGVGERVVEGLNAMSSAEFPANAQVVAEIDHLVVVQEDVGGDDSIAGAVHYVHLVDDGAGTLVVRDWFVASVCARGDGPTELCV